MTMELPPTMEPPPDANLDDVFNELSDILKTHADTAERDYALVSLKVNELIIRELRYISNALETIAQQSDPT